MKFKLSSLFLISSLFIICFTYSQNTNFEKVLNAYNGESIDEIYFELKKIDTTDISVYDQATWLYYYADYLFYKDKHDEAYQATLKSKSKFIALGKVKDVKDCNILLLGILSHQNNLNIDKNQIIDELEDYGLKNKDTTALVSVYNEIATKYLDLKDAENSIRYFKKIRAIDELRNDTLKVAHNNINIGTVFNFVLNNQDSALYYTKKAVPTLIKYKDYQNLAYNYNNQAKQYTQQKNYTEAINYLKKADKINLKGFEDKSKVIFYENMAEVYMLSGDYKNSAVYYKKTDDLKDSINDIQQNIAISEIKEKYDNEKLRADNLEIEAKRIQNRNIAFGLGSSLLLGSIILFLVYSNFKRRQKLSKQEQEIENQKIINQLKEQELKAIDAMIEGQEKERQRIANDLHDDLGGLMATVKLHFNAFKEKNTPELYDKTNLLIDEAYQKVRTVAHAKNAGVIAKQGLLKAVQNMADKISASNQIQIEVLDHGLDDRLENSLELTIFRIVQELITNIIKHAKATKASIHLTNHEDSLNIMVEDNGKGFNPSQITKTKAGMGISSIDKRIEYLGGSMTIESEKNKGATIIIDIPL